MSLERETYANMKKNRSTIFELTLYLLTVAEALADQIHRGVPTALAWAATMDIIWVERSTAPVMCLLFGYNRLMWLSETHAEVRGRVSL
jgi:hypothetical protein